MSGITLVEPIAYNDCDYLILALIRRRRPIRQLLRRNSAMKLLKCGDEVAVLPQTGALARDVLDVAIVIYVGPKLIELADGRIYFADDGRSLNGSEHDCIVPATEEHRSVLLAKLR